MDDIPPPEAFEQPVEPVRRGPRRWLMGLVTLIVVASLVVLAFVSSGGIIRGDLTHNSDTVGPRLAIVDGQGRLSAVDAATGARTSLGRSGVRFSFPAWSADGTRIATIGQGSAGTGVHVLAPAIDDGTASGAPGRDTVVYESPDRPPFYLYWAPGGQNVWFLTTESDGLALRVAPGDGSSSDVIVRRGAPMYWDFVDATHVLLNAGTGGPDAFFGEVGPDGSAAPGTETRTGSFRAPDVSPDGRFRAFLAAGDAPAGEVVREARDGSGATRVRVFGPAAMSFSPTGDALAFVAPDRLSNNGTPLPIGPLRILDPAASEPRTVLDGTVVAFFWSPSGKAIAALRLGGSDDQVTRAVVGGPATSEAAAGVAWPIVRTASMHLPEDVGQGAAPTAGMALGLTFVGVVDGSVSPDRTVHVSDLFVNQVLPYFDQYALSHRFWSPDGHSFLLPIVGDGDVVSLFAVPGDGSDPEPIADGEFGSWSP